MNTNNKLRQVRFGLWSLLIIACLLGCTLSIAKDPGEKIVEAKSAPSAVESKTQFATFGENTIAYRIVGHGNPLILCQRFRGNLDDWDPAFLDALAREHTVVIFNYSGFASSTGKPHETMGHYATDVTNLASYLGFERFALGGWSFGGCVAQAVAAIYPEQVSSLILFGTRPPGENIEPPEPIFYEHAYIVDYGLEDEIILFFEPASEPSRKAAALSHARIAARTTDKDLHVSQDKWEYYRKGLEDFAQDAYGILDAMKAGSTPTMVISGDHEICFPPENWFSLNQKLQSTQVIVIPESGHGVQHQHPELISNYITAFIENNNAFGSNTISHD